MGLLFNGSSTMMTATPVPITTFPFSCGMWICPYSVTPSVEHTVVYIGTTVNVYAVAITAASKWLLYGGSGSVLSTPSAVAHTWYYVVFRHIANNNKRFSILDPVNGVIQMQSTNTTALTHTHYGLGSAGSNVNHFLGPFAEFWIANVDPTPGGGVMDEAVMRNLAYRGPLSVPLVANNLMEYRSFYQAAANDTGVPLGEYTRGRGRLAWAAVDPGRGAHPPLPVGYRRPGDYTANRPV